MHSKFVPYMDPEYISPSMFPADSGKSLARAYVPMQPYIGLLPLNTALEKGTVFPNLVIPYPEN
ncbi:spore coat associated protein CotJA [Clostridium sp. JNZ X4-2]